jgi:hypothetical protein
MIKDFKNFIKESVENKGVGPGNKGLFPSAPKKQTINRAIPTMDFLRIGKHILTKKIDGFIDSVQNENIFITDRITGEVQKYTLKEVIREIAKAKDAPVKDIPVEGFKGTPAWATTPKVHKIEEDKGFVEDGTLIGETYNPDAEDSAATEEDEDVQEDYEEEGKGKQHWEAGDEEGYEDDDKLVPTAPNSTDFRLRGTEDNPEGLPNKGNKREMPNESWVKYWEKFNENQRHLIEDEDIEEPMDEEDVEMEEEIPYIGNESNPIEARKRTKIEDYSEENPEPLPGDVADNGFDDIDDRFDQFEK